MNAAEIKARISAIRKAHHYGLTPVEEGIVSLIEDMAGVKEEEPDLTKDMPKEVATEEDDDDEE